MTPRTLARRICTLPEHSPVTTSFELTLKKQKVWGNKNLWYKSQREHWQGWLRYYDTEGAYGRIPDPNGTAEYAYNHVICPPMVLWLGEASGLPKATVVRAARAALSADSSLSAMATAIRKVIPWELVHAQFGTKA